MTSRGDGRRAYHETKQRSHTCQDEKLKERGEGKSSSRGILWGGHRAPSERVMAEYAVADADAATVLAEDEDEVAAILVAELGREDEEVGFLDVARIEVRLFDEHEGELVERTSNSIHFSAMMESLAKNTLLLPSAVASVMTLALQL